MCDLEKVSQNAPKDIFEVIIVRENQHPMCDLESESQNGCVMYTFSLTVSLTALFPSLFSLHM